jgi:hypothetical protein
MDHGPENPKMNPHYCDNLEFGIWDYSTISAYNKLILNGIPIQFQDKYITSQIQIKLTVPTGVLCVNVKIIIIKLKRLTIVHKCMIFVSNYSSFTCKITTV